jgi:PBP1b-binding outer membrane lipoprotein LpoB
MKYLKLMAVLLLLGVTVYSEPARSQDKQSETPQQSQTKLPAHAKVYIAPMGGFETPLKKAIADKKVPIEIVEQREQAEYEITGTSESKKASTAKKVIMGSWHSDEDASIKVANLKTGEIVFAYSAHKQDSAHGQRSTAEACAKHLKDEGVAAAK